MPSFLLICVLVVVFLRVGPLAVDSTIVRARAATPAQPSPCDTIPAYRQLDFWVGEWRVLLGERQVGTNRIEKVVHGCALIEHWRDGRGIEGMSLFYYEPTQRQWKQVWVDPGGVKEKHLIATLEQGGVRFQGELRRGGRIVLDRTTLSPLGGGRVRQLIEQSEDGGTTWQARFDAVYVPAA
jgi:hypothetical protein